MPDRRRHRGPAPGDERLFDEAVAPRLATATAELSWLLTRGYPPAASLKLVGDRHRLVARQRRAVSGAACAEPVRRRRRAARLPLEALAGRPLHVDAFNCVILGESLRSGAPVFRGRDLALRDLASVRGTWRPVEETEPVVAALVGRLRSAGPSTVTWWVDRPVSNSGRLAALLRTVSEAAGLPAAAHVVPHVDTCLAEAAASLPGAVLATADAALLDRAPAWCDLPDALLGHLPRPAWLLDLSEAPPEAPPATAATH